MHVVFFYTCKKYKVQKRKYECLSMLEKKSTMYSNKHLMDFFPFV